jgi:hypothetical protein
VATDIAPASSRGAYDPHAAVKRIRRITLRKRLQSRAGRFAWAPDGKRAPELRGQCSQRREAFLSCVGVRTAEGARGVPGRRASSLAAPSALAKRDPSSSSTGRGRTHRLQRSPRPATTGGRQPRHRPSARSDSPSSSRRQRIWGEALDSAVSDHTVLRPLRAAQLQHQRGRRWAAPVPTNIFSQRTNPSLDGGVPPSIFPEAEDRGTCRSQTQRFASVPPAPRHR